MIVARLLLVALVIAVAALGLAWLFSGDRKYLAYILQVLRFALIVGVVAALAYLIERAVLI